MDIDGDKLMGNFRMNFGVNVTPSSAPMTGPVASVEQKPAESFPIGAPMSSVIEKMEMLTLRQCAETNVPLSVFSAAVAQAGASYPPFPSAAMKRDTLVIISAEGPDLPEERDGISMDDDLKSLEENLRATVLLIEKARHLNVNPKNLEHHREALEAEKFEHENRIRFGVRMTHVASIVERHRNMMLSAAKDGIVPDFNDIPSVNVLGYRYVWHIGQWQWRKIEELGGRTRIGVHFCDDSGGKPGYLSATDCLKILRECKRVAEEYMAEVAKEEIDPSFYIHWTKRCSEKLGQLILGYERELKSGNPVYSSAGRIIHHCAILDDAMRRDGLYKNHGWRIPIIEIFDQYSRLIFGENV
ncbi:MAG: hypothetical protein LBT64_02675 [Puniceicoccales bacterium]|jgi:hypothetical protein|nr:hypothetical protein [Puniceicoccales bacterium]